MRLLCDEMLAGLGRWLRAAGHDTLIAERVADDRVLLETVVAEDRVLLTRDRVLADRGGVGVRTVHLKSDRVSAQAQELKHRLDIDWLHAPFTRCLVDNTPLKAAQGHEMGTIPPGARALGGPVMACRSCGRLYWQGSHHRRMLRCLSSWRSATP